MRINLFLLLFLTSALFTFSAFGQTTPDRTEFQIWTETTLDIPIIKELDENQKPSTKLSVFFVGTLRFGRPKIAAVDERIGAGFNWRIRKGLSYSSSYLYRYAEAVRGKPEYEHTIRFDLSAEKKWKHFSLKDRNRIEYRIRNNKPDSVRYRNKLTAKFPIKNDGKEIFAPFVATEPFFDFTGSQFSSNEFSAGITKKLNKNLSADVYYLNKANRSGTPKYINAIGVNLTITLD